jgi:hypothetical protein
MSAAFKQSDVTRAIRAAKAAGLESFDVIMAADGTPMIRVRPANGNDVPQDLLDELEAWDRDQDAA